MHSLLPMLAFLLATAALAVAPDREAARVSAGSTAIEHLAVDPDGRLVAGVAGSSVALLDTATWSASTESPCNVTWPAVSTSTAADAVNVWVGCDDGTVQGLVWTEGGGATTMTDGTGADVVYDVASERIVGLWWYDGELYALSQGDFDALTLHRIDLTAGTVDGGSWPVSFGVYTGFQDGVVVDGALLVSNGNERMVRVTLSDSPGVFPTLNQFYVFSVLDVAPAAGGNVWAVASGGYLLEYLSTEASWTTLSSSLSSPEAVGSSLEGGNRFLMTVDASGGTIWDVSAEGTLTGAQTATFDLTDGVSDLVVSGDYTYGAGDDGAFAVFTSAPWVSNVSASPATAVAGATVTVSFDVDVASTYEIRVGGDVTGTGTRVANGSASAGTVTETLTVDGSWPEGSNDVWVFATDGDGNEGHGVARVTVDNPPSKPKLVDADLGFGDGYLTLSFDGISDADLDHYEIYVSTDPFSPSDYPTGGPGTPITLQAAGGDHVSTTIPDLTNDTTYYVAVRAYDQGGLEGPMSDVIEGTPRQTFSASELAGETGGPSGCDATGGSRVGMLGLLIAMALVSSTARAADAEKKKPHDRFDGDFELRYGAIHLVDPNLIQVYGDTGNNVLQGEFGPQFWNVLEFDANFGFLQELDHTVDASGAPSSQRTMMTWLPLGLDASLRLDLLDEQVIVPYARFGGDYVFWQEAWDADSTGTTKDHLGGSKTGYHYGFGGQLLLDTFAPARASLLEAQSGIRDTYFVVDWRKQHVGGGDGLDFSGTELTFGLKLDY